GDLAPLRTPLPQDAPRRSNPARAWLLDSVFPHGSRPPDARRRHLLWRQCRLLLARAAYVFRDQSAAWRTSVRGHGDRLGPRHDRAVVLAAPEAVVPTLAADPVRVRALDAHLGNSWGSRGRPAGHGAGPGSGLGRPAGAGACARSTGGRRVHRPVGGVGALRLRGSAPCGSGGADGALVLAAPARHRPADLSERPRGAD